MKIAGTNTLLQALEQVENQPRWEDRREARRSRRQPVRGEAELHPVDRTHIDRTPMDVAVRDISRCGVGLLSPVPVQVNSLWRCTFLRHGRVFSEQTIIIRHCTSLSEGVYHIGGQFVIDCATMEMLDADPNDM